MDMIAFIFGVIARYVRQKTRGLVHPELWLTYKLMLTMCVVQHLCKKIQL